MSRLKKFLKDNNALDKFTNNFDITYKHNEYSRLSECFEKSDEDAIDDSFNWGTTEQDRP